MTAAERRKKMLADHGVPLAILDNMTFSQIARAFALVTGFDNNRCWSWDDCPEELKTALFGGLDK